MSFAALSLILNLLIIGLLMATISYCFVLNKRIKILQDSKSELAGLLRHFDEATTRASESIVALQSASKKIGENIQARTEKANFLLDDLTFMLEKGNKLADRLEANFAVSKARSRVTASDKADEIVSDNGKTTDIMEDFSAISESHPVAKPLEKLSTREKTAASLEAVLDRVIGRNKPNNSMSGGKNHDHRPKNSTARSKAEQELLEMIRAGIKG